MVPFCPLHFSYSSVRTSYSDHGSNTTTQTIATQDDLVVRYDGCGSPISKKDDYYLNPSSQESMGKIPLRVTDGNCYRAKVE